MSDRVTRIGSALTLARIVVAAGLVVRLGGIGIGRLPPPGALAGALALLYLVGALAGGRDASRSTGRSMVGRGWDLVAKRPFDVAILAVCLLGVALRIWGLTSFLWDIPIGVDEGRLAHSVLHFFDTGEIDHSTVEHYPGIYFWVLAAVYLLTYLWGLMAGVGSSLYEIPLTYYTHAGRLAGVAFEAGTIAFTGLIGRRLGGPWAGVLAAGVIAVSPLSIKTSTQLRAEAPLLLFLTAAVWVTLLLYDEGKPRHAVAAGTLAGCAVAIKYSAVFVLIPTCAAALIAARREGAPTAIGGRDRAAETPNGRAGLGGGAGRFSRLRLTLLSFGAALAVTNHFLWYDFSSFINQLAAEVSFTGAGHWSAQENPAWFYAAMLGDQGTGWAILLAATAAAAAALAVPRATTLLALAFPLTYVAFMTQRPSQFDRWVYPLSPFVAAVGAATFLAALSFITRGARPRRGGAGGDAAVAKPRFAPWLAAALGVALIAPFFLGAAVGISRRVAPGTHAVVIDWLLERSEEGDRVLVPPYWLGSLVGGPLRPSYEADFRRVVESRRYYTASHRWVVVPEPFIDSVDFGGFQLAKLFLPDYSFGGASGFDFAVYIPPSVAVDDTTVALTPADPRLLDFLGPEWNAAELDPLLIPATGASLYLPPRSLPDVQIELELLDEGSAPAAEPADAPLDVQLGTERVRLRAESLGDGRIVVTSARIEPTWLGDGIIRVWLAPSRGAPLQLIRFELR